MMCPLLQLWLQTECTIFEEDFTVSSTITQVLPADPMRFAILAGNTQAVLLNGGFGTTAPTNPTFMAGTSTTGLLLLRDEIGDLITLPLWLKSSGTAIFTTIQALSYNPKRYHTAMERIHEWISRS